MSAPLVATNQLATSHTGRRLLVAAGVLLCAVILMPPLAILAAANQTSNAPSAEATREIPASFLAAYQHAAAATGIDWAVLAAIGEVECNHGRSQLPGCNPVGSVNRAGAAGPMQFLATTWRLGATRGTSPPPGPPSAGASAGYASDGDGDGIANVWNISDAALAAARLLKANGAPVDYQTALYAYNHSDEYVARVLRIAESYRATTIPTVSSVDAGSPGAWALAYLGTPYVWGGNHAPPASQLGDALPQPTRALDGRVGFFDCSSLASWAYAKTRGRWIGGTTSEQWQLASELPGAQRGYGAPPDGWRAGDLGFYEALDHVVLALSPTSFVEAPHTGADVRVGLFSERGEPYGYARYPTPRVNQGGH